MEMCVLGPFRRQKSAFPKSKSLEMCLPIIPRGCGSGPHSFSKLPDPFSQYLALLGPNTWNEYCKNIEKSNDFCLVLLFLTNVAF